MLHNLHQERMRWLLIYQIHCSNWGFISSMHSFIACHTPDRESRVQNRIWPDFAFGSVNKRSGYKIKKAHKCASVISFAVFTLHSSKKFRHVLLLSEINPFFFCCQEEHLRWIRCLRPRENPPPSSLETPFDFQSKENECARCALVREPVRSEKT